MSDERADRASEADRTLVRIRALGSEPPADDVLDDLSPRERLQLVHELSRRMWELSGRSEPTYSRSEIPVRVVRRA